MSYYRDDAPELSMGAVPMYECEECGDDFRPDHAEQMFCGQECADAHFGGTGTEYD